MKQIRHILTGLLALTALTVSAGITPTKVKSAFGSKGDILSKDMVVDTRQMKHFSVSSDDIKDPAEREAMRMQMRAKSDRTNTMVKPVRKEGEKLYTVKCVFEGEDWPYFAIYNTDFFLETRNSVWNESGETDTYYFQVPAGTYDVYADFWSNAEGMTGWGRLVHEDIVVNSDTEVSFSADELTEKVVIKPLLRNGTEAVLPLYIELDEEPWYELDYTGATANFSYLSYTLFREGCEAICTGMAVANMREEGEEEVFFSNKLSDKYHFVFQYFIEDMNGEIQITTTDMAGSESGVVNNYIKDFVKYGVPSFGKTPLYDEFGIGNYPLAITGLLWVNDVEVGGGGKYVTTTDPIVYCAVQPMDFVDLKTPVRVVNVQAEKVIKWEEDMGDGEIVEFSETVRAEMAGLPALYDKGKWEYINQNHAECGNWAYQKPEVGPVLEYPGVPAYCYFSDEITQPIGNSSPVLALMTQVRVYPDATIFSFEPQAYIGRYGEVRNCDYWTLHTVVNLDGEQVFDSDSGDYLEDWCIENSTDGHEKGLIEATYTNRNVLVDETIPGFNITTMKVDERNEDLCTPTTQMLIFKNTDGAITDRFSKGEEGIIEFSAGDFNWVDTEDNWYYTCDEADVKVEYAAYGEENFMPLEVEEIPENYYMPGFGYFYRGSLADVTMPTSNGWYDLRFTLTDKAGNEMVQHISPAFKIESNTSVVAMAIDGTKVWSANGKIFANGSDIASMSLYAADGKLIATSAGNTLPTNGYRGIAIVKVTNNNGETTTHKTAVR